MKGIIIGIVFTLILSGTTVLASGKMLEVFYNVKDIKINKVSKMPEEKPFTNNGVTYVPLRYISEQIGLAIKWDGATGTIHIGEMDEQNAFYPGRDMQHMNYQEGWSGNYYDYEFNKSAGIKNNIGNEYSNFIVLGIDSWARGDEKWNLIEFPLNGQYKNFNATIGLTHKSKETSASGKLEILVDDVLAKSYDINPGDMTQDISVNVENGNKITFKLVGSERNASLGVGLFDARFYK